MVSVARRVATLGLMGFLLGAGVTAEATTLWQAISCAIFKQSRRRDRTVASSFRRRAWCPG